MISSPSPARSGKTSRDELPLHAVALHDGFDLLAVVDHCAIDGFVVVVLLPVDDSARSFGADQLFRAAPFQRDHDDVDVASLLCAIAFGYGSRQVRKEAL